MVGQRQTNGGRNFFVEFLKIAVTVLPIIFVFGQRSGAIEAELKAIRGAIEAGDSAVLEKAFRYTDNELNRAIQQRRQECDRRHGIK